MTTLNTYVELVTQNTNTQNIVVTDTDITVDMVNPSCGTRTEVAITPTPTKEQPKAFTVTYTECGDVETHIMSGTGYDTLSCALGLWFG